MILENGFCTRCGHKLSEEDLYCPQCGAPQFTVEVQEPPKWLWLYFFIPFLIAAFGSLIIMSLSQYGFLFIFLPFVFIRGNRRTKLGSVISGIFLGAAIGMIIGLILSFAGISLF